MEILLEAIVIEYCVLTVMGFIRYKWKKLASWEDGILDFMCSLYSFGSMLLKPIIKFGKFILGIDKTDNTLNESLLLSNQECLDIVKEFENHPYESPTLENNPVTSDNIQQLDIQAVGLVSKYADSENKDLKKMAKNTIETYYMRTRERQIDVEISIVTPTRLLIEIPLSDKAIKELKEQKLEQQKANLKTFDVLEEEINLDEEIDLFEDSGGDSQ